MVCGGIHTRKIPTFDQDLLRGKRVLCSLANLTRRDAVEFLELARTVPVIAQTTRHALSAANEALDALRSGSISGAAVLAP